ncbi:MAG: class I SAM-dependent methyltransferase [Candidatus Methanoperedens sp.]|nr:class I SAM-dependent methyltransferase [Candidatus Methanoperedens sp.]
MLIHDIFGLQAGENVYFVEESYASLKNNALSLHYLEQIPGGSHEEIIGLKDENGDMAGLAVYNQETEDSPAFWAIFTCLVSSKPVPGENSRKFLKIAGNLNIGTYRQTLSKELNDAIIEYYSHALLDRQLCEDCRISKEPYEMVYIESRNFRLKELLNKYELKGDILEICCGNGMSTLPLHEQGYAPLAVDNDKCQICQGLEHNVLDPKKTIVLDATRLSQFFAENSFDTIAGFMLGMIYSYNQELWEKIMEESAKILRPGGMMLLTVYKKEEIEILGKALEKSGIKGNIIDNTDSKGIYDQWVYIGTK